MGEINASIVGSPPHIHGTAQTRMIMLDVLIAMIFPAIMSVWLFGWGTLALIVVCAVVCAATEFCCCLVMKRPVSVGDLSALVTGVLIAFNLPAGFSLWQAALGCVAAIAVVKMMFGGLGQNIVNPALIGRIVLMASFPESINSMTAPFASKGVDVISQATPLAAGEAVYNYKDLLFGLHAGCIGEVCALALIVGGLYLVIRRVITPLIPLCYIGTVFVLSWILGQDPLYQILSGGLMLGAIFMATDYTTTPLTTAGRAVFAVGCGVITVVIRNYAALAEGVSFAIVIMNILVPLIDRAFRITPFGGQGRISAMMNAITTRRKGGRSKR